MLGVPLLNIPITRGELSLLGRVSTRTLQRWEAEGYGPKPRRISSKRVVYDRADVQNFLKTKV